MQNTAGFESLWCDDSRAWQLWLETNHTFEREIWLEFFRAPIRKKKPAATAGPSYDEALDEAICFGWIDVSVKKIDDERYAMRFVPRKNPANWTAANVERFKKLTARGLVKPAGRAAIDSKFLT